MVKPIGKPGHFLKKLKIKLPHDTTILLLGNGQKKKKKKEKKTIYQRGTYSPVFTSALFMIAKIWKISWTV